MPCSSAFVDGYINGVQSVHGTVSIDSWQLYYSWLFCLWSAHSEDNLCLHRNPPGLAPKIELCMSVENTETQRSTEHACVCQIEFNKLYVFTMHLYISIVMYPTLTTETRHHHYKLTPHHLQSRTLLTIIPQYSIPVLAKCI